MRQPQCVINKLLPGFWTCAFSDMDGLAILAFHLNSAFYELIKFKSIIFLPIKAMKLKKINCLDIVLHLQYYVLPQ